MKTVCFFLDLLYIFFVICVFHNNKILGINILSFLFFKQKNSFYKQETNQPPTFLNGHHRAQRLQTSKVDRSFWKLFQMINLTFIFNIDFLTILLLFSNNPTLNPRSCDFVRLSKSQDSGSVFKFANHLLHI